jgi:enhancing lycopene biosynthesis protein 2
MKKIAVILAGSGYLDGSEIREAVGVLWALSSYPVEVHCFAPDVPQRDVVNHLTGQPADERRNVLVESARIARGKVRPLSALIADEFDAIIMPGGFGAAKNLCTFAFEGAEGSVIPDLAQVLNDFQEAGKPIGAACIAPAILALNWKDKQLELTVGAASDSSAEIEKLGHKHIVTKPNEIHIDRAHRIVTTPAYMYDDAPLHEIFEGIRKMVEECLNRD